MRLCIAEKNTVGSVQWAVCSRWYSTWRADGLGGHVGGVENDEVFSLVSVDGQASEAAGPPEERGAAAEACRAAQAGCQMRTDNNQRLP